jgi:hypothetical protein
MLTKIASALLDSTKHCCYFWCISLLIPQIKAWALHKTHKQIIKIRFKVQLESKTKFKKREKDLPCQWI